MPLHVSCQREKGKEMRHDGVYPYIESALHLALSGGLPGRCARVPWPGVLVAPVDSELRNNEDLHLLSRVFFLPQK